MSDEVKPEAVPKLEEKPKLPLWRRIFTFKNLFWAGSSVAALKLGYSSKMPEPEPHKSGRSPASQSLLINADQIPEAIQLAQHQERIESLTKLVEAQIKSSQILEARVDEYQRQDHDAIESFNRKIEELKQIFQASQRTQALIEKVNPNQKVN